MLSFTPLKRFVCTPWAVTHQMATGWRDYVRQTGVDAATPVRLAQHTALFWTSLLAHQRPTFAHPNTVRREWPLALLRDFTVGEPTDDQIPTLVLPPRSGMTSAGVDLSSTASLIGTLLEAGHTRTHSLEWLAPVGDTQRAGIDDHVHIVEEAIAELGGRVHLVGYSQGGWLAAMIAALAPSTVASLSLGATPIDFHAGLDLPGRISYFALGGVSSAAEGLDDVTWSYPGVLQAGLLRTMEWTEDTARVARLWANISDQERFAENVAIQHWLETPEDLPGPFVRWTVDELFGANGLVNNTVEVDGRPVRLAEISCPLFLIAGERDLICPPAQLWALTDQVGTPAEQIHCDRAPVGHLDLLFDRDILAEHWAPLLRAAGTHR